MFHYQINYRMEGVSMFLVTIFFIVILYAIVYYSGYDTINKSDFKIIVSLLLTKCLRVSFKKSSNFSIMPQIKIVLFWWSSKQITVYWIQSSFSRDSRRNVSTPFLQNFRWRWRRWRYVNINDNFDTGKSCSAKQN